MNRASIVKLIAAALFWCLELGPVPLFAAAPRVESSSTSVAAADAAPQTPKSRQALERLKALRRELKQKAEKLQKKIQAVNQPNPRVNSPEPTFAPPQKLPVPISPPAAGGFDRFMNGLAGLMTKPWRGNLIVWMPAVTTDPNTGVTLGVMPILLVPEKNTGRIRQLFAPSYTYNTLFGQTLSSNYYLYPSSFSRFDTEASLSQRTNRDVEAHYQNNAVWGPVASLNADAGYTVDGSPRFYGIGPQSRESGQSGYTSRLAYGRFEPGINFLSHWRFSAGVVLREFETAENVIPEVADMKRRYPNVAGVGGARTVAQEARLLLDTRDSAQTPSRGSSGEIVVEKTDAGWGSDADFFRFRIEGKQFIPWRGGRQTTVLRARYEKVNGSNIPFQELSMLGGRDTLRGFGAGRFVDQGSVVFNGEQRISLASLRLMDMDMHVEVAPFVDIGTVFPNMEDIERRYFRSVEGAALRMVFKPNVVGDIDIGVGNEGPALFVDINYPF